MERHAPLWLLTLAALALAATPARADDEVESWFLDDGTEVLLVEDHRSPVVSLQITFPAGTHGDWAWEHFANTAMAIQTHDPDGAFDAAADDLATDLGGWVGGLWSGINVRCRKDDLPAALGLLREIMANRNFDRAELRRWRKNRKVYWDSREKDARYCQNRAVAQLLWQPDDPRRRGYEQLRLNPTDPGALADVRDTLIRLPGRRIGVAGDLTRAEVDELVAGLLPAPLEEVPEGLAPSYGPTAEIGPGNDEQIPVARLTQVYFGYARDSIRYDDEDYPAFWVANHVLGGHFYSRLSVALRHEGGETYGAWSGGLGLDATASFQLGTFTNADNVDVADGKLRDVLRTFWEDGITDEERVAALANLRGRQPFWRQSPDQILGTALFERQLGFLEGIHELHLEQAEALTLDEINAFVREFFDPADFAMIHVVPE